jgi:hypothetical protein
VKIVVVAPFGVEVRTLTTQSYDVSEQREILTALLEDPVDAIALGPDALQTGVLAGEVLAKLMAGAAGCFPSLENARSPVSMAVASSGIMIASYCRLDCPFPGISTKTALI